jgi:hypothetical protein
MHAKGPRRVDPASFLGVPQAGERWLLLISVEVHHALWMVYMWAGS